MSEYKGKIAYVSLHKLPQSLRNKLKIYFSSVGSPCSYLYCQFSDNCIQVKLVPASAKLGTAQLQLVDIIHRYVNIYS